MISFSKEELGTEYDLVAAVGLMLRMVFEEEVWDAAPSLKGLRMECEPLASKSPWSELRRNSGILEQG